MRLMHSPEMQIHIRASAKDRLYFACENCARFTRTPVYIVKIRELRTTAENQA